MKSHEIVLRLHAELKADINANQDWLEDCELSEIIEAILLVDEAIKLKTSQNH